LWWIVRRLAASNCGPVNALEIFVALDFLNAVEADSKGRVLSEEATDQIFGLGVDRRLRELDFLALLDVVIRVKVRSSLKRRYPVEELVQDDSERPVVT
jgi:hypothetical protein